MHDAVYLAALESVVPGVHDGPGIAVPVATEDAPCPWSHFGIGRAQDQSIYVDALWHFQLDPCAAELAKAKHFCGQARDALLGKALNKLIAGYPCRIVVPIKSKERAVALGRA